MNDEEDFKSKTRLKQEMDELQDIGKQLLDLNKAQLAKIPLTEDLAEAIEEAARIRKNEAKRRHLQYIGKLMRNADHEAIRESLERILSPHSNRHLELLRDGLVQSEDSNAEIQKTLQTYPNADRQQLAQLVRNARKEASVLAENPEAGKATQARKLFKYLVSLED